MRRVIRTGLKWLLIPPVVAAVIGWLMGPAFLHPVRRALTAELIHEADVAFTPMGAHREEFDVRGADGVLLRGWKVRPPQANRAWVLLFHGVADNRVGVVGHAELLLKSGYSVVMMDARAHGASEGRIATYGWLERQDTRAIVTALEATEHPAHLFALGESMGAGIVLQSAAVEPRIEAVVAEASFANLTEAAYDYAGLRRFPWLGKTLFAPGAWMMVYRGQSLAGFPAAEVSPEKAVVMRAFPVLLICDADDVALPCRHTKMIYAAALGPKQMWVVPGAYHAAALGFQPAEFRRRVLSFYASAGTAQALHAQP
jgi:uncharacterized protein